MYTVNLLPESYRKTKVSAVRQFHRSPLFFLVIGILIAIVVVVEGLSQVNRMRLAGLSQRLHTLQPKKQIFDALRTNLQTLRDENAVFDQLSHRRRQWAPILNILSDFVPEGVWFTDLSLERDVLMVQGSAVSQGGEEMAKIGRFVQELKGNQTFNDIVRDIQIESIKSVQEKDVEVVQFTLICKLVVSSLSHK